MPSRSCSCGGTCPRARAGCSSTAARRRPSGSSRGSRSEVRESTGEELEEPGDSITVRQRKTISFRTIASVAFKSYPKRTALGFALFVGQAFIYNAVTFGLGTFLVEFYGISDSKVPFYIVLFAVSNFLGPLLLGRLFDTVGRKPMIAGTYIGSAVVLSVLTFLFVGDSLGTWGFMAFLLATFFLASAGASAAYLTVSEIFPMETRALAIAFFYAIGTAVGGITGPYLFGKMIESGEKSQVAIAFYIGAAIMAIGGIVELFLGVKAEQESLEDIAKPLTAEDAEEDGERDRDEGGARSPGERERDRATRGRARARDGAIASGQGRPRPRRACSSPLRPRSRSSARFRPSSTRSRAARPTERRELAQLRRRALLGSRPLPGGPARGGRVRARAPCLAQPVRPGRLADQRRYRQRGDSLAAAHEAHSLARRELHVHRAGLDADRGGQALSHVVAERRQLRLLACHRGVHVRRRDTPASSSIALTARSSSIESASRQRSSVSGKCWPMSPMPAAPSSASITAWVSTSASE